MKRYLINYIPDNNLKKIKNDCKDEIQTIRTNSICIADRTWNYLQFLFRKFDLDDDKKLIHWISETYKNLRVDMYFMDKNPISTAGALLYLGILNVHTHLKMQHKISQAEIGFILGISNVPILKQSQRINKFLSEKELSHVI